jgi:hypothetical protein
LTVDGKGLVFQAMITVGAIYIDGEDSFILSYLDFAKSFQGII